MIERSARIHNPGILENIPLNTVAAGVLTMHTSVSTATTTTPFYNNIFTASCMFFLVACICPLAPFPYVESGSVPDGVF